MRWIEVPPVSRKLALAAGWKFYQGKMPCARGHNSKRYVSSGECQDCVKARNHRNGTSTEGRQRDRRRNLKRYYGLTEEQYTDLLVAQAGRCGICDGCFESTPNVDHCHSTGRVRGLLCGPCNRALGRLGDSIEGLERAITYLRQTNQDTGSESP